MTKSILMMALLVMSLSVFSSAAVAAGGGGYNQPETTFAVYFAKSTHYTRDGRVISKEYPNAAGLNEEHVMLVVEHRVQPGVYLGASIVPEDSYGEPMVGLTVGLKTPGVIQFGVDLGLASKNIMEWKSQNEGRYLNEDGSSNYSTVRDFAPIFDLNATINLSPSVAVSVFYTPSIDNDQRGKGTEVVGFGVRMGW